MTLNKFQKLVLIVVVIDVLLVIISFILTETHVVSIPIGISLQVGITVLSIMIIAYLGYKDLH